MAVSVATAGGFVGVSDQRFSYLGGGLALDPPRLYTSDRSISVPTSIKFRWLQSEPSDRLPPQSFTVCFWPAGAISMIRCQAYTPSQLQVICCRLQQRRRSSFIILTYQVVIFSSDGSSSARRVSSSTLPDGVGTDDKQYTLHTSDLSTQPYMCVRV